MPLAEKYLMDIPHVTAVELPLHVNNPDRAVDRLGGRKRVAQVINHRDKLATAMSHTPLGNVLELKLRPKDPFHHPVQLLFLGLEKVLLKVSVPKSQLPENYKDKPLAEVLAGTRYKVQPVAIVDKTYSFKLIADFQVLTRHNPVARDYAQDFLEQTNLDELKQYFGAHDGFVGLNDAPNPENFADIDHQLLPPPVMLPIRFPFDYKYQRNPFTQVVTGADGRRTVVQTKETIKLHLIIIEYGLPIPQGPAPANEAHLAKLRLKQWDEGLVEAGLLETIEWIEAVFSTKPVWLRKHLDDIVPEHLRKYLKQALPFVTFIFKLGPWRFCNLRYGVDPRLDVKFWKYQTEYFRVTDLRLAVAREHKKNTYALVTRAVPQLVDDRAKAEQMKLKVVTLLVFTGEMLPTTVTFQLGDITDPDITSILTDAVRLLGFRDQPDAQDGWLSRQTMEVVRRIARYKLSRLVKEEAISQDKIYNITRGDYTGLVGATGDDDATIDPELEGEDKDEEDDEEDEVIDAKTAELDEEDVLARVDRMVGTKAGEQLRGLTGFIKQDDVALM